MHAYAAPIQADLDRLQVTMDVIASKWAMRVLTHLATGTLRFNELLGGIDGVSRRMLSATLRKLERDGLIERHVYALVPSRVEYELSDAGVALLVALDALIAWEAENREALVAARRRFERIQQSSAAGRERQAMSQARSPRIH